MVAERPINRVLRILLTGLMVGLLLPTRLAASPPVGTAVVNQASVRFSDANGNAAAVLPAHSATAQTVIGGRPVLTIDKLESSDPVSAGDVLTYTIAYRNAGNAAATAVTLVDTLSEHVIFQSASDSGGFVAGAGTGGTVTWSMGSLAAGASGVRTVTVRVKTPGDYPPGDPNTITTGTSIPNTAILSAAEDATRVDITSTVGSASRLEITKSASSGGATPGGTITYALQYRNSGNLSASGVTLRDRIPTGTRLAAGSVTGGGMVSGDALVWNIGSLPAGADGDVSFRVTVSPLAVDGDTIRNTATIRSASQGPVLSNELVHTVSSSSTLPAMSFRKLDGPDPVYVNNRLTYRIEIRNDGGVPLTQVTVRDPVPPQTTFVSADNGGTLVADEVIWNIATLAAGATQTLELVVQVRPDTADGSVVQNTAEVTAQQIPHSTPTAATTVLERTPGTIRFLDAFGNAAAGYDIGDTICIEVSDADRNTDPLTAETVSVTLEHDISGDVESVTLTETGPASGVFRGCLSSAAAGAAPGNGVISVSQDSSLTVTYTDSLDGSPVSKASVLIDPFGEVFDSVTGDPVAGAVVTLYWQSAPGVRVPADTHPLWPAGQANPVTTAADGKFQFPLVPPGDFFLVVNPGPGYTFPTAISNAQLPAGFVIGVGSRGETFTLSPGDPPLNLDIPVDPPVGQLTIAKTANRDAAAIGEMVRYRITLTNSGGSPVTGLTINDRLPHGFLYVAGSSRFDGAPVTDPVDGGPRSLAWTIPALPTAAAAVLSYRVIVGPDAHRGDGRNSVSADGTSLGLPVASNTAVKRIRIREGVFTLKAIIMGKVFIDADGNGVQTCGNSPKCSNERTPDRLAEPGVPHVSLYLEDGRRVTTDGQGKFSIPAVAPGTHVLRLDEDSLPEGLAPVGISNRFMGDERSQFIDVDRGGLFKANFGLRRIREAPKPEPDAASVPAEPESAPNDSPSSKASMKPTIPSSTPSPAAALTAADAPSAAAPEKATVTGKGSRVRRRPSLTAPVAAVLDKDARIQVIGRRGDWLQIVSSPETYGWIHRSLVLTEAAMPSAEPLNKGPKARIRVDAGRFRQAPALTSATLALLYRGEALAILGREKDWVFIMRGNAEMGWLHQSLIHAEPNAPETAATPDAPAPPAGPSTPSPASAMAAGPGDTAAPEVRKEIAERSPRIEDRIVSMSSELAILSPEDGRILTENVVPVRIKVPLGATATLYVNDAPIGHDRIGKIIRSPKNRVTVYEYVSVGIPGEDPATLRVVMTDSFGNVRGESSITVVPPGSPRRLVLQPQTPEIPADGRSLAKVHVKLVDKNGNAVPHAYPVTIDASSGEISGRDADPSAPGFQMVCRGDDTVFSLKAPIESAEALITAEADGLRNQTRVFFAPHQRDLLIVGSGDITVGRASGGGNLDVLKEDSGVTEGTYAKSRGALFVKGKVLGEMVLTAAYDSDKERRDDLFHESDRKADEESQYPIYGDGSVVDMEARSRDPLYLKLEKNRSYFLYGDFETELDRTRLAAYQRSFTGARYELNTDRYHLRSFVTHADQIQVVNTFRGRGVSGYYYLDRRPVIDGSERVVLETRDARSLDRVLSREVMSRGSDYTMDYDGGGVLFKSPVSSHDADMNPIYIVVNYETESDAEKHYMYGGRDRPPSSTG